MSHWSIIHIQRCIIYNIDHMTDYDHLPPQEYSHPSRQEAENFAELLRCELPLQLQHELEGHFQKESGTVGKVIRDRLAGIVESVTQRILETWRDHATVTKIAASETESTRDSTLGRQYRGDTRVTEKESMLSSTASNVFDDQEAIRFPFPVGMSPVESPKISDFHLFQGGDFSSQIDDKLLESLLERGSDLALDVGSGSCNPPVYGSYIGLLDYGSPWDTTYRTTSNSTAEDNDSES